MPILVLATLNDHKVDELRHRLASTIPNWELQGAKDFIGTKRWQEVGRTFQTNARMKAEFVRAHCKHWVLSDDSGLDIAALNGLPGVDSSSWGGEEGNHAKNNAKLIEQMRMQTNMKARFLCTLCLISPNGDARFFEGECAGTITVEAKGQKGFGYDPHFIPAGFSVSMAELSPTEKNEISHRGKALEKFEHFLKTVK